MGGVDGGEKGKAKERIAKGDRRQKTKGKENGEVDGRKFSGCGGGGGRVREQRRKREITTRACECVVQLDAVYSTAGGMQDVERDG